MHRFHKIFKKGRARNKDKIQLLISYHQVLQQPIKYTNHQLKLDMLAIQAIYQKEQFRLYLRPMEQID
jgi:hypothetical protein